MDVAASASGRAGAAAAVRVPTATDRHALVVLVDGSPRVSQYLAGVARSLTDTKKTVCVAGDSYVYFTTKPIVKFKPF